MLHIADFFCELYDEHDGARAVRALPSARADVTVRHWRRRIKAAICEGRYDVDRAHSDIATDTTGLKAIAHLMGIDAALERVNPFRAASPPPALEPLVKQYEHYGRFSDKADGALLPRAAAPGRPNQEPAVFADAFGSVIRVPESTWYRTPHSVLPLSAQLTSDELAMGLRVGCVPLVMSADDMTFQAVERDDIRYYHITVDETAVASRIDETLDAVDAARVQVAVLPELVCTQDLSRRWAEAVRARVRAGSPLRWLFSGTGDLRKNGRPVNAGMLIDAATGKAVVTQTKTMAFTLTPDQVSRWNVPLPDDHALDEYIERGTEHAVVETGAGRLAVLICEDLAEVTVVGDAVIDFGVSMLLAPVFSEPTDPQYWEHQRAKVYATAAGTTTIVANSMVVGRLQQAAGNRESGDALHAALVHSPIASAPHTGSIGGAENETSVSVFVIEAGKPGGITAEWLR